MTPNHICALGHFWCDTTTKYLQWQFELFTEKMSDGNLYLLAVGYIAFYVVIIIPARSAGPAGPPGPHSGGALYTRWGKSSCPQVGGTELVYDGITGGSFYNHQGGGANYLCMPRDPEYSTTLIYRTGFDDHAPLYGSEYEAPVQGSHDHNVPCAVCYVSTRPTVIMIPAKASCPPTWTREYYGYLMTQHKVHHRTMFECVDKDQESLAGSQGDTNGVLFYHAEASCSPGHLPCPPYDINQHKELNCVVCTK